METFSKNRYYTQINLHLLIKQSIIPNTKSLIFYYSTAFGNAGVPQAQLKAQLLCSREIKEVSVLVSSCCYNKLL